MFSRLLWVGFIVICIGLVAFFQNDTSPRANDNSFTPQNQTYSLKLDAQTQPALGEYSLSQSGQVDQSNVKTSPPQIASGSEFARQGNSQQASAEEKSLRMRIEAMEYTPKNRTDISGSYDHATTSPPTRNSLEFQNTLNDKISHTNAWHAKVANNPLLYKQIAANKAPEALKSHSE
jgi:hypothetical protein